MNASDTIFALSSGAPPAAIGVIRISGAQAALAVRALAGRLPAPRRASLATLRDAAGVMLDSALVLWFPGPNTATGEDLAELHCHGGRAVIAAIETALAALPGLRRAEPGEFTRRAFANGRLDLAEAEGLADLLSAETELQRAAALGAMQGALSRQVEGWRARVLGLSAELEAVLDFSDEEDAADLPDGFTWNIAALAGELAEWLARPRSEKLGEGFRVVLAGPPNAGKSTLFNALVESEAAITSPIAGTTRDVIERSVAIAGVPFTFVDTAGLRDASSDAIETIGIDRARGELERADVVLWLGPEGEGPSAAWEIAAQADRADFVAKAQARLDKAKAEACMQPRGFPIFWICKGSFSANSTNFLTSNSSFCSIFCALSDKHTSETAELLKTIVFLNKKSKNFQNSQNSLEIFPKFFRNFRIFFKFF